MYLLYVFLKIIYYYKMIDSITFNIFSYIICIISVYLVDLTSQYLFYNIRDHIRSLTASTRWLFIHIITNLSYVFYIFRIN